MDLDEDAVRDALQHKARSIVLQSCIRQARSARQVSEITGLPIVSCYRHIKELVAAGLLHVERAAMTPEGRPYDLYRSSLETASLTVDGDALCVTWQQRPKMRDRLYGLWRQMEDRT